MALVGDSYEYYDKSFYDLTVPIAKVEELYSGCRWAEGPVWFNEHATLIWSDIPNQRLLRWIEGQGVSEFRSRSNFANGNTRDMQGRLVSCEHGTRRVTRTEPDGTITVIADSYDGKRLNSPNDVVVKSDGTIWFTDPDYGIMSDYEGFKSARLPKLEVLRKAVHANPLFLEDPNLFALVTDIAMPSPDANGLAVFGLEDIPALADLIVEQFLTSTTATGTLDRCG